VVTDMAVTALPMTILVIICLRLLTLNLLLRENIDGV
jgi:hypothetical protein